jgi:NhaP-type Na+/H+ or K+/H+ antiporter
MANRIACSLALIAFAMALLIGCFEADNTFGTIVLRAIGAMFGMLVVGFVIGIMAEKMMNEHLAAEEKKILDPTKETSVDGR